MKHIVLILLTTLPTFCMAKSAAATPQEPEIKRKEAKDQTPEAAEGIARTSKARDEKYAAADKPNTQRLPEEIAKLLEHGHDAESEKELLQYIAQHPEVTNMVDQEGSNALMLVLINQKPSLPVIRELIKRTKNIDLRNNASETALMAAAHQGIEEAAQLLVKRGADVNAQDNMGQTPLMHATSNVQNANIINLLIQKGARINEQDNEGNSALNLAIFWDLHPKVEDQLPAPQQAKTVQLLLDRGASIELKTTSTPRSPLMEAVLAGNVPVAKVLLENRADIETTDRHGSTPLLTAILNRQYINQDASPEQHVENREIYLQIIKLLLQARANPNALDMYNQSAIITAIVAEDAPVVRELLIHGAQNKAATAHVWVPSELALKQQKNRPENDSPEKQRAINEIVDMLLHTKELIAQYKESEAEKRAAQRALAHHRVIPEISEIIGEFIAEPKVRAGQTAEQGAIINKIKSALRRNDGNMLIELFTKEPHLLEIADESGNTPLLLSLHYQQHSPYVQGTKNALNIIIAALRAADEKAKGKHHYLAKALEHKNRQDLDAVALAKALKLPKHVITYLESQKKGAGK